MIKVAMSCYMYFLTIKKMKVKEKGKRNMGLGVIAVQMVMKAMEEGRPLKIVGGQPGTEP